MRRPCLFFIFLALLSISKNLRSQTIAFASPVEISNGSVSGVTSLDAADFNLDGLLDVVVLEGGKHAEKPTFAWFEQKSQDNWIRHELGNMKQVDSFLGSAKCADMDTDGDMDIVFTSDNHIRGPIKVFIAENPGGTAVYQPWKLHVIATFEGFHANDMKIADMDNDRRNDVVIRHKNPNTLRILFQDSGKKWHIKSMNTENLGLEGFAIGNLNRDATLDIAINGYWFKGPSEPRKGEYKLFSIDTIFTTINGNTKEDIGDINADGRNDILISPAEDYYNGKDHVLAWYQAPENPEITGDWIQHIVRKNYNRGHAVKLADMDNDGDLDIVSGQAWPPMRITVYLNNNGDFSQTYPVIQGKGIYSGSIKDMDNDGDIDIVGEETYSQNSKPWYYENLLLPYKKRVE